MKLKPYPAYKDSGVPWLGSVPKHWDILPNRAFFTEVNERNHPHEEMLSVTITRGVIRQQSLLAGGSKKDSSNQDKTAYKLVQPRDIAYNKMRAWQGAIGASDLRGIVSPAYVVMRLRENRDPRYFHHLYRTPHFAKEAERWSYGITSDMWSLRPEHFKMIYTPLPPLNEQSAIVRYLDHIDRRLQHYIRAKRRLIVLLNEQKKAIIHRAVTRGLDPNVRLKPSGVEWLGDVPEYWEVRRNATLFRERIERGDPQWPILVVSLRTGVTIGNDEDEDGRPRRLIEDRANYKKALHGDIAYNMMRMWQGAVGIAPVDGLVSPAYVVAVPRPGVHSTYYSHWFCTDLCKAQVNRVSTGIVSDRNRLYWDNFKMLYAPVPPFEEQARIVVFIAEATAQVVKAITKTERGINLIREYRTRLIADVVTGKFDVREAAANLPDEAYEQEEFDNAEVITNGDDMAEDADLEVAIEEAEA